IGPDPRNFNQRVSLGRNDLLIRTFLKSFVKNRSFRQDTVAQLNNAPLPRSGSGKKRRSWTLSIKILETLHGY
ncbi:hypothetical protein QP231_16195, partial [Klebsiella pneumoniae]|nr:hypothetical protein [Klebsiella pneumoniae]